MTALPVPPRSSHLSLNTFLFLSSPKLTGTQRFHFRTRRQELNSVEGGKSTLSNKIEYDTDFCFKGTRTNLNYLDQLAKFHKQYGTNLNRFPSVDKRPLDLYKLKKAVEVRGGFEKVCKDKKWAEIGRDLGYSGKIMSSLSTSLKNSYQRWLHPYEEYLRTVKPGMQQQQDFDYGGNFSPSPATSPTKRLHSQGQPDPPGLESPCMQASDALTASIGHGESAIQPTPLPALQVTKIEEPRPMSSGFMAVNSGGFSAVNAPRSGFVAVNHTQPVSSKRDSEVCVGTPYPNGVATAPATVDTPIIIQNQERPAPSTNGDIGSNPLKRSLSHESMNCESGSDGVNGDGDGSNGRRSKRLKKGSSLSIHPAISKKTYFPSSGMQIYVLTAIFALQITYQPWLEVI